MSHQVRARRRRRAMRWLDDAVTVLLVVGFVLCVVAVASGSFQVRPVLSGSMRPELPVGGVVVTRRVPVADVHPGEVIVFREPDGSQNLVVHRILSETPGPTGAVLRTKGDANSTPDPWLITLRGEYAYRAVFAVPLVGYAAVWAHNPAGRHTLIVIGTLLLAIAVVGGLALRRRQAQRPSPGSRTSRGGLGDDVRRQTSMPSTGVAWRWPGDRGVVDGSAVAARPFE